MIVWLTNVADPSPSAQIDAAPLIGGIDPDVRGVKKNTEPSGELRRTTVHHESKHALGENARIVRGENSLGKLNARTMQVSMVRWTARVKPPRGRWADVVARKVPLLGAVGRCE